MSIVGSILIALFAICPGMIPASFIAKKSGFRRFICDSIVWSLLMLSAVTWIPFASRIPFGAWSLAFVVLSVVGLAFGITRARKRLLLGCDANWWLLGPTLFALGTYALIGLVRPNIDWDGITYYLSLGLQYALSGHASSSIYPFISTYPHAVNTMPPLVPSLYGAAISTALQFHWIPDSVIRLIPLVFVFGTYLSVWLIAQRFLPPIWAQLVAVIWLLAPSTIFGVCAFPLYLDLSFTFFCAYFLATMLAEDTTRTDLLRLGLGASALILDKVDGLVFIAIALGTLWLRTLPTWLARIFALLAIIAVTGLSVKVHFITHSYPASLWLALALVTGIYLLSIRRNWTRVTIPIGGILLFVLGLLPGVARAIELTYAAGSPAAYYIPSWAKNVPGGWLGAVHAIASASVYSGSGKPGVPENYAGALVLWWGFGPAIGLTCFLTALALLGRKKEVPDALYSLIGIIAAFDVAFLTIFELVDLRDILPIVPGITAIAIVGLHRFLGLKDRPSPWVLALIIAVDLPFAWIGQQGFFGDAFRLNQVFDWTAWYSLSTKALASEVALLLIIGTLWISVRYLARRGRLPALGSWVSWSAIALSVVLTFLPVVVTAGSPGFAAQSAQIFENEAFGYYPILSQVLRDPSIHRVLAYKSYGIPWFSLGRVQRIDLTDATDVAFYRKGLAEPEPTRRIAALEVQAAIVPSANSPEFLTFQRLLSALGLDNVDDMLDPLLGHIVDNGHWAAVTYHQFTAPGEQARVEVVTKSGRSQLASDRESVFPLHRWPLSALRIVMSKAAMPAQRLRVRIVAEQENVPLESPARRFTVTGTAQGPVVLLPVSRIFRAAYQAGLQVWPGIRIFSMTMRQNGIPLTFSSVGFRITPIGEDRPLATFGGLPFVLHPEDSIVSNISLLRSQPVPGTEIYPYAPTAIDATSIAGLGLHIHSNAVCGDTNSVLATLGFRKTLATGQVLARQITLAVRAGRLEISRAQLRREGLTGYLLTSLELRSSTPACNIYQRFISYGIPVASSDSAKPSFARLNALFELTVRRRE